MTAAPSPPRRFAAWRIEAPHFAVSPFGGPCVLRSVAWPRSIHIDANTTKRRYLYGLLQDVADQVYQFIWFVTRCCRSSLSHARKWDPCPFTGRWLHLKEPITLVFSQSREAPNNENLKNAYPVPPQFRWRRDGPQLPERQRVRLERNTCVHNPDGGLRCVYLEYERAYRIPVLLV